MYLVVVVFSNLSREKITSCLLKIPFTNRTERNYLFKSVVVYNGKKQVEIQKVARWVLFFFYTSSSASIKLVFSTFDNMNKIKKSIRGQKNAGKLIDSSSKFYKEKCKTEEWQFDDGTMVERTMVNYVVIIIKI